MKQRNLNRMAMLLAVLFVTAGMVTASAQGRWGQGRRAGATATPGETEDRDAVHPRLDRLAERLELTDEQREAARELREQGRQQGLELRKQMMRLRNELQGEMLKDDPEMTSLREIARRMGEVRTSQQIHRLEQRIAFRNLLTPEQRDRLLSMGPVMGRAMGREHRPGRGSPARYGHGARRGADWDGQRPGHGRGPGHGMSPRGD